MRRSAVVVSALLSLPLPGRSQSLSPDPGTRFAEGARAMRAAERLPPGELKNQQLRLAEEAFGQVVAVKPESARTWLSLARVRWALGDADGALMAAEKLLAAANEHNVPDPEERARLRSDADELMPTIASQLLEATASLVGDPKREKLNEAEALLGRTVAGRPAAAEVWFHLARSRLALANLEPANAAVEKWLLAAGEAAQRCLATTTRQNIPDPERRSTLVVDLQKLQANIAAGRQRLPEARVGLARNAAGGDQWAEVIRVLDPRERAPGETYAKDWPPDQAYTQEAFFMLAKAYQATGEWPTAREWYQRYLNHAPNGLYANDCRDRLGIVRRQYLDDVLKAIHAHLNDAAIDRETRFTRCMAETEKARRFAMGSDEGDLLYAEGVILAGVNRTGEARQRFQNYRRQAPNGRFLDSVLRYLSQLDKPRLLFIQGNRLRSVIADGSEPAALSTEEQGEARDAAVSPSRNRVALLTWSAKSGGYSIYVIDLNTNAAKQIWSCRGAESQVRDLCWSPPVQFPARDGQLAFVGPDATGDCFLWTYDAATGQEAVPVVRSKVPAAERSRLFVRWAPGGGYLAFCDARRRLCIAQPPFDAAHTLLSEVTVDPGTLQWTTGAGSDAYPLLFGASARGIFCIDGKDLAASRASMRILEPLARSAVPTNAIGVSSDGDVIGVHRGGTLELYRVQDAQPLGTPIAGVDRFVFSPLGSRLAYRTKDAVYVSRLDGNREHDVRLSGTDGQSQFAWSPAGNQVLWWRDDRVFLCFDRAQLAGDVIAEKGNTFAAPRWAVDDRAVAMQRVQGDNESIVVLMRGVAETERQLRTVALAAGNARLVDWVR